MATTVSGLVIRQTLRERGWCYLGAQVGAGNAAYITDTTRLKSVGLASTMFDGAVVRIASGARAGDTTFVDYLDQDNGKINVSPNLGGTGLADTDTYEIWLKGIDPDAADRLRDEQLRKTCSIWRVQPLCAIDDGDMESSGVTAWTAVSGATRTKAYASFPEIHGRRQLQVVHTTAATDYVHSNSIYVQPGERYFLEVPVSSYVTATSAPAKATVVAQDITNGAAISLGGIVTSHTGRGWGVISLLFTIPTGCYEIQIRLMSDTASSTTVWGHFNFHRRGRTRVALPDRITTIKRVGTTFRLNDPTSAISEMNDNRYKLAEWANVERKQTGSQVSLWFNPSLENTPVFYHERGYFDALQTDYFTTAGRATGDTATTDCPRDYIVAALATALSAEMRAIYPNDPYWQSAWVTASAELNFYEGQFGPEPVLIESNEEPVRIPQLRV